MHSIIIGTAADIPGKELFTGQPSGSAMPLVWAHAEYVKLLRSLSDGRVFDLPPQTVQRYIKEKVGSNRVNWRINNKCSSIPAGKVLRLQLPAKAAVHWSTDGWKTARDLETRPTGLQAQVADLPVDSLPTGTTILFTFRWLEGDAWEGTDYSVQIV